MWGFVLLMMIALCDAAMLLIWLLLINANKNGHDVRDRDR